MGILILVSIIVFGSLPFSILFKKIKILNPLPYFFLYGSLFTVLFLYLISAYVTHSIYWGLIIFLSFIIPLDIICCVKKLVVVASIKNILIFLGLTMLFYFIANKTFQYHNQTFYIASNLYADMGVHIPIIRSFSQGANLPFELPFFAGKNLTYHFLYDFFTGILEYSGLPINIAYNLIFSFVFSSLFFVCIDVGKIVFKKRWIGIIAFILFIFPSDLSFINVLNNPAKEPVLNVWFHNFYRINSFLGERTMGGFLYFNTYLNQRHLFFALAASLAVFVPLWVAVAEKSKKQSMQGVLLIAILISLIFLWSVPVFVFMALLFITLLLIFRARPKNLFIGFIIIMLIAIPQTLLLTGGSKNEILFNPGFLIHDNFSFANLTFLWVFNLGVGIPTILGGFIIASKTQKKLFMVLLPLFIIPNIFQVARYMFDNHKFFNFWFLYMCFFSASFIAYLFKGKNPMKILAGFILIILTISGVLNFLVVKNDVLAPVSDYSHNPSIKKVNSLIPFYKTVITNGEIFDPLSISGRKTFLGRIYHIYSFGGDPQERLYAINDLFLSSKIEKIKTISQKEKIEYIIIYNDKNVKNLKPVERQVLDMNFKILYEDNFVTLYKI